MEFPDSLLYSKDHEWVRVEDDIAIVGISDYAQDELGDIVFVELPETGIQIRSSASFGVAESVKTVSDLFCPVSGEIIEINKKLEDEPELVNQSPYDSGWMIKVKISDPAELKGLKPAAAYKAYIEEN